MSGGARSSGSGMSGSNSASTGSQDHSSKDHSASKFRMLDTDKDGYLSQMELSAWKSNSSDALQLKP